MGEYASLGRLKNGRLELLQPTEGLPETDPRAFFQDSRGWLWIGQRYKGVSVTQEPDADAPKFVNYSTENGLASDTVWTITEDDFGRMYFGTGKGLDRLDVSTGRIRHFTTADGLAGDQIHHCIKDTRGAIWAAPITGLSKLNTRAERVLSRAPPIYLARIEIAGEDLPISETGIAIAPGLELSASRNNLLIEFVGLEFYGERALKYQYKLEGADQDWSPPTEQRSVNYAQLAPGSYRFLARAINQQGIASEEPAALQFRILLPVWRRWWFLTLVAIFIGLVIYSSHRYRVARLIELERVRTRIASDLHDDIGSNLSVIVGLSDVLRRQADGADSPTAARLSLIAAVSQRSLEAISDIVWAVNPKKDHLLDLTQRLRLFADEAFFTHNIEFEFSAPHLASDKRIGAETRREVFLIFKEAVNNIVRHSGCAKAEATLQVDHNTLVLLISDDGRGFDTTLTRAGEGLASMRRRAEKIDGEIDVVSKPGEGSSIRLRAPLG
jgi:signal transduction histidine kinase